VHLDHPAQFRKPGGTAMTTQDADPRRRPTPQTTVEAIMYCVRERGLAALTEPGNVERLNRCDEGALAEIKRRCAKAKPS
jgi:hypothetical protein